MSESSDANDRFLSDTPGYRAFQRSRPASASPLRAALATVMSGWVDLRWPRRSVLGPEALRRDGATLGGSSRCFL
jgi:hypothetical protein